MRYPTPFERHDTYAGWQPLFAFPFHTTRRDSAGTQRKVQLWRMVARNGQWHSPNAWRDRSTLLAAGLYHVRSGALNWRLANASAVPAQAQKGA